MEFLVKKIVKNPYEEAQELEIKELEKIIQYARDKFFNSESIMSDNIYDLLIDFLIYKDPKNKFIKKIGSDIKSKDKVKLDYHLGSMDKIKPPSNKLDKWINKYDGPYIISEKLDGVSALLVYKKNGDIKLFTRGTSTHGLDITSIIKYITRIPAFNRMEEYIKKNKINSTNKDNLIAFRGELIISRKEFDSKWKSTKSNARNTVSGLVNSKKIDPILAGTASLVIYELVDPLMKLLDQLKIVKDIGFKTVHNKTVEEINYETLSKYLRKRKNKSKYIIDGIIVSNNDLHKRNIKGNPDYAFAFKDILEDQKAISEIIDVEWTVSKDGYINPVVIINPVEIGGVEIGRITAYNAKYVVDNKIGIGAKIELIRSGDVIPKIIKVLTPAKKTSLPDGKWSWNETKVDIITDNLNCKEVEIKNNHYFFSTLDTKGLGLRVIEKLYDAGLKSILDILKATKDDFIKVDGFKDKSSNNLVKSIKKATNSINMYDLMKASNKLGHGMGSERSKLVLEYLPNIQNDFDKWSTEEFIEKLKDIPSFEEKTSQLFVDNYPKFIEFYKTIKKYVNIKKENSVKKTKSELNGKTIVLSGFRDKDLEKILEQLDVKVSNSVSKNTSILVVKDSDVIKEKTGKVKKAQDLKVKIITKKELLDITKIKTV